jgi:hypothetical protein
MSEKEKVVVDAAFMREDKKTLPCAVAVFLSQEYDISLKEIGETCNNHGIKITDCRLGCFK